MMLHPVFAEVRHALGKLVRPWLGSYIAERWPASGRQMGIIATLMLEWAFQFQALAWACRQSTT